MLFFDLSKIEVFFMLDIKEIRANAADIEKKLQTKDPEISLKALVSLDEELRRLKTETDALKTKRNDLSSQIGTLKREKKDTAELMREVGLIGDEIHQKDERLKKVEQDFVHEIEKLPNIPMDDIKVSQDPKENVVVKEWGKKREFDFPFKNHLELNEKLKLFDFERAAKTSGAGWPAYRGLGAQLEWALINYMLETHIKNGYTMWMPPILVRRETLYGSGQLPKFESQQFKLGDDDYPLWLIPTAEVSLNGLHQDEILKDEDLPLKYCAYTPCFRREAGAAGKQERGLIRMHQFNKVEMFAFTKPEESVKIFEEMRKSAETILEGLGIHFRETLLVTGDMSFGSAKTIDVEVWLPGQDRYYEVSSISNCTDYQARRSGIRFRKGNEKPEFVHTLNGSGLATSRLMVAILENNQNADGSVTIPEVLRKSLGGISVLKPCV